jgi:hypothetical protein
MADTTTHPMEGGCGRLKNGARGLDLSRAARDAGGFRLCGAAPRGERHHSCRNVAMKNGRCHLHGGRSTGPRTVEGRKRAQRARWKHGERSAATMDQRRTFRALLRAVDDAHDALLDDEDPRPLLDEVTQAIDRLHRAPHT